MASAVAASVTNNSTFVFGGRVKTEFIYQDDKCVVFEEDIEDRAAPNHFIVVPRKAIPRLCDATAEDEKILGYLLLIARRVAKAQGLSDSGFRVVMSEGPQSCQKVDQFYIQVLGGRQMVWPFCHLLLTVKQVAASRCLPGYHVTVDESHTQNKFICLHVFGRALHHMLWPVGPGSRL